MKRNNHECVTCQPHATAAAAGRLRLCLTPRGHPPRHPAPPLACGEGYPRARLSAAKPSHRQGRRSGQTIWDRRGMLNHAQITLFIIIGLLIILAVGITFYVARTVEFQRETTVPQAEQISTEFEPVRQYIQACLRQTGIRGLQVVGQQGGYAYPEERGIIALEQVPTEGAAVRFSRDVPYWSYLESRNDCSSECNTGSKRPTIRDIQDELDRYINREIAGCFDFTELEQQGFSISIAGEPESRTIIGETDITFSVQLPIEITHGAASQGMEQFISPLPYNFRAVYDAAFQLNEDLQASAFLELATLSMIDSFDGIQGGTQNNRLPPLAQTDFGYRFAYWLLHDVRNDITDYLSSIVPYARVRDTPGYADIPATTLLQQGVYSTFQYQPDAPLPYAVRFHYLGWPLYLDFGQGQMLLPTTHSSPLLPFIPAAQEYRFAYDLSYPVVIELLDENVPLDFNGPYSFIIAREVNIRNNQPLGDNPLNILFQGEDPLFCNPLQWTNQATITVTDSTAPLPDAEVILTVGGQRCPMGITNSEGILETGFPGAIGQLEAAKPGYFSSSQLFAPSIRETTIIMQQLKEITVQVQKLSFRKQAGWQPGSPLPLTADEEAVISITRIAEPGEEELNEAIAIRGTEQQAVSLIPGSYQLSATLIRHLQQPYIIPASQKTYDTLPFVPFAGEKTIDIPEISFAEFFLAGGLAFDASSAWAAQLSGNTLTIKLIAFEPADFTIVDDLGQLDRIDDYSLQYRQQLLPEWSP